MAGAEAADREARYAALWLAIELRWGGGDTMGDTDGWFPPLSTPQQAAGWWAGEPTAAPAAPYIPPAPAARPATSR